jgi:hypothetical protein
VESRTITATPNVVHESAPNAAFKEIKDTTALLAAIDFGTELYTKIPFVARADYYFLNQGERTPCGTIEAANLSVDTGAAVDMLGVQMPVDTVADARLGRVLGPRGGRMGESRRTGLVGTRYGGRGTVGGRFRRVYSEQDECMDSGASSCMTRFLDTIMGLQQTDKARSVQGFNGGVEPITREGVNCDGKRIFLVPTMGNKTLLSAYEYAGPSGGIWLTQEGRVQDRWR